MGKVEAELVSVTAGEVRVRWPEIADTVKYELAWDAGVANASALTPVTQTEATTHLFTNMTLCQPYRFKTRAKNLCEFGPFSQVTQFFASSVPKPLDSL